MKLKQSTKDWRVIEDDMGNPMYNYLGIHQSDPQELIKSIDHLETKIYELELLLDENNIDH